MKRAVIFGTYNTATDGLWTLTALTLSDPAYDQNFVKIPGSSVTLDMSTVLSDGEPTYGQRTLTATFESSEGDRMTRKARIDAMTNLLDGRRLDIILPDDPDHFLTGRVSVQMVYSDLAHSSVRIIAICDPWRYNAQETVVTLTATAKEQTALLSNLGRRSVVPIIQVTDEVLLKFNNTTLALSPGTYKIPDIFLSTGAHELIYSSVANGSMTLTYREASL